MIARTALSLALAGLLAATAAFAAQPPAQPEQPRRICRGGERQLGSRIRTPPRCHTARQWREEDEAKARLPISLQMTEGQNTGRSRPPQR